MCPLCRLPVAKNHKFGQILTFGGLLYRPAFTDEGRIWCATVDARSTLTRQISSQRVYFAVIWRRETGKFIILLTSSFCGVASWRRSKKVERGCTTTNIPYPTVSKSFLYSDLQKRDGQTNTQTKINVFSRPCDG